MRMSRLLVGGAAALLLVATAATPSGAVWDPGLGGSRGTGSNTNLVLSGIGPGQGVTGWIGPVGSISNPANPYPTGDPPDPSFTSQDESFAGIILATPPGGGSALEMYCINIRTLTNVGIGYELGDWTSANVSNVGFVARLLNDYFPNTAEPVALGSDSQKAAAVQAAIWYFSDNFVVKSTDPLRAAVAAIVTDVLAKGPLVQPPPPTLQIAPSTITGSTGMPTGPFTVTTGATQAIVSAGSAQMFTDAAGTNPIANGTGVPSGTQIWVQDSSPGTVTLSATALDTVPTGNVYLYDGNSPGITAAQKLILAHTGVVLTNVKAQATLALPGSLTVTKTITGTAAGQQGDIQIDVSCNGVGLDPFIIPAGTTGSPSKTYDNLLAGSTCTITESIDGATAMVTVVTVPAGPATIVSGTTVPAAVSDEYTPGTTTTTTTTTEASTTTTEAVAPETLPATGSGSVPGAPIAGLLVVAGLGVVLLVRRRTPG